MIQPVLRYHHQQARGVTACAWSPDGSRLAVSHLPQQLQLWDPASGSLLRSWPTPSTDWLTWSPDGSLLLSSSEVWDAHTGQLLLRLHSTPLALSPDGTILACDTSTALLLQDPRHGLFLERLPLPDPTSSIATCAWSPDGSLLAAYCDLDYPYGAIFLWQVSTGQLLLRLRDHVGAPSALAWSPDGSLLASSSDDGSLSLWNPRSGQLLLRLSHPRSISSLAWSPDGSLLASSSNDGSLSLWNPHSGQLLLRLSHSRSISSLAWSPDGSLLASGDSNGSLSLW
uniref:WD40 repeat domain-containing protein n=1 Tax=Thermogemmatispora sp. TaxID=1968838 RepID=UPI0035E3FF75